MLMRLAVLGRCSICGTTPCGRSSSTRPTRPIVLAAGGANFPGWRASVAATPRSSAAATPFSSVFRAAQRCPWTNSKPNSPPSVRSVATITSSAPQSAPTTSLFSLMAAQSSAAPRTSPKRAACMPSTSEIDPAIQLAAEAICSADALLIGAGAGMGVDSGLPDFRGNEGFWNAYPPFKKLGLSFVKLANPYWFRQDPEQAWGFYGHRRNLYRATRPHAGFAIVRSWCERAPAGYFVFTSNVDGHFQKAGFAAERIVECHGSLEHLQCMRYCTPDIWPAPHEMIEIDNATFRARPTLPSCPRCGSLARPNVLL